MNSQQACISSSKNAIVKQSTMSSGNRRKRVIPLSFQLAGIGLNGLSWFNKEWSAKILSNIWFSVFKTKPKQWVFNFWQKADQSLTLTLDDKTIPIYSWGEGPLVVLMHGWSGSGTQFRYFIPALVAAGYRVITFDAPAHGQNPGRQSHLVEFSDTLVAIQGQIGNIDTVVAHSLGAMATVLASQRDLQVQQLVLIAPHLDLQKMFESYRDLLALNTTLANRFHQLIGHKMGEILDNANPWNILNPQSLMTQNTPPGLLVYDRDDKEVDIAQFAEIDSVWDNHQRIETEGLGHNGILKNERVIESVIAYLLSVKQ